MFPFNDWQTRPLFSQTKSDMGRIDNKHAVAGGAQNKQQTATLSGEACSEHANMLAYLRPIWMASLHLRCSAAGNGIWPSSGPFEASWWSAESWQQQSPSGSLVWLHDTKIWDKNLFLRATFRLIDDGSLSTITVISHLPCLFFPDQSRRDGGAVRVPQQPPARRRSGRGAGTPRCHQVRVAQEAGGVRQNVAQPLVRSARGSAALLQGWGGNQATGKAQIPSTPM